uniref:Miff domain-containing protein n=1 Tax=Syphacia muris TaxID=451379 RepID=A0A0N5ANN3_9BILA
MNITFVVIKNAQIRDLTTQRLMNSTRIRALLIQQKNQLKRVFGGVPISSATIFLTKLQNVVEDNTRLLTLVGLVGFFITVTYVIAAVKVCRDHYYKKLAKRRSVIRAVSENNVPDYGSCEETPRQKLQASSRTQNQINPSEMLDLDVSIPVPSPSSIDDRSIQRMFECDPSQLPSEQPLWSRNVSLEEPIAETNKQLNTKQRQNSKNKFPTDETNKELLVNQPQLQLNNVDDAMEISEYDNQNNKTAEYRDKFCEKITAEPRVIRSKTAHEIGNWSSDSEDDQNDVYYRLSEVEDDETKLEGYNKNETDSDSDEPRKVNHESSLDNTHSYQRLEESPTPVSRISESTTMI